MRPPNVWLIIISTSILTFLIRYLPVAFLYDRKLSPMLYRFLSNLPIAVLASIVAQSTFIKGGRVYSGLEDYYVVGLVCSVILAVWTRNLIVIVFGSMAVVGLLTVLIG